MKTVVSEAYQSKKATLLNFITNFKSQGHKIYGGDRNTLKTFDLEGEKVTVKAFKTPNVVNRIVYNYFRKNKAQRSFEHAHILLSLNIGTPFPVAYMQNSNALSFLDSYYICKHINYDLTYRELVEQPNFPQHEAILRAFTAFTFKLHESGVFFKDHSPGNTLITINNGDYKFYLVDLNRMTFGKLSFQDRMENMKRLTPKKEMVAIMANEYAKLSGELEGRIFKTLWELTSDFQMKFYRKRRLKKRFLFWQNRE